MILKVNKAIYFEENKTFFFVIKQKYTYIYIFSQPLLKRKFPFSKK